MDWQEQNQTKWNETWNKKNWYFRDMSIDNCFYIPFTSLRGNTCFCPACDNFFDRQEYSSAP